MVDDKDDEKAPVEEAQPKGKKKLILIIVAVLVVVLLVGAGVGGFFLLKGKHSGGGAAKKGEAKTEAVSKSEGESKESGPIEALEPFVVNLADTENTRYLKVVMQLELNSPDLKGEIEKKMPEIRDEIIMLLSSKSFDDLSTPPGKRSLKRSIIESANKFLTTGKVTNVFFSDFVIQ